MKTEKMRRIVGVTLHESIEPWGRRIDRGPRVEFEVDELGIWIVPTQLPDEPTLLPWAAVHYADARVVDIPVPPVVSTTPKQIKPTKKSPKKKRA